MFTSNPQQPTVISTQTIVTPQLSQNQATFQQQQKHQTTKTINSIHQTLPTPKIETNPTTNSQLLFNEPLVLAPSAINGQFMLSLSADQLEQLQKTNPPTPQFNLNGPTTLLINQQAELQNKINQQQVIQQQRVQSSPSPQTFNVKTNVLTQQNVNKSTQSEFIVQNTKPIVTTPSPKSKVANKKTKTTPIFNLIKSKCKNDVKSVITPISSAQTSVISNNCVNNTTPGLISPHSLSSSVNSPIPSISSSNNIIFSSSPSVISTPVFSNSHIVFTSNSGGTSVSSGMSMPTIVASSSGNVPQLIPIPHSTGAIISGVMPTQAPYQRVQTIQLTPQKQQVSAFVFRLMKQLESDQR